MSVVPQRREDVGASARWGDLGVRAASALVLVVIAATSVWAGGAVFVVAWLLASVAVSWEWQRLVGGASPNARALVGGVALLAAVVVARSDLRDAALVVLIACGIQALLAGDGRRSWAAGGMLYAGLFLLSLIALRSSFPFGSRSIVWLFAVVWSTDVFAYLGGRLVGGPKLWPRISPSKTWSGTLAGVLAGAAVGTVVALRDLPSPSAFVPVLMLSLAAAVLSQAGDAFESAIKRSFGAKDSSRLIPGHGGVMDRLDGFIAAAVFAFLFGLLRDQPSVASGLFYWA